MRRLFTVLGCLMMFSVAYGQNAIVGSGFSSGWVGGNSDFTYFSSNFGSSYGLTTNANGTGDQYFRIGIDWSGTVAQNTLTNNTDVQVSSGTEYTLDATNTTNGAMYINVGNMANTYTFKTRNAGTNPSRELIIFEVEGDVRTVDNVTATPSVPVTNQPTTITATLNDDINTGQGIYLRYSTDNFSTSTVVEMSESTPTSFTVDIPGQTFNTTISFYVFSSGSGLTIDPVDADWYTINGNNNGGSNYVLSVVPVELSKFTASREANSIALNWTTLSEENNAGFNIEKSVNGKDFEIIGYVEGSGNSIEQLDYSFVDENPSNGVNYYRLKQMDMDGQFEYSKIVSVEFDNQVQATVFPNPTSDVLTISGDIQEVVNVRVFDAFGKIVLQQSQRIDNQSDINLSDLPAGNYFLQIVSDTTQKVIFSNTIVKN